MIQYPHYPMQTLGKGYKTQQTTSTQARCKDGMRGSGLVDAQDSEVHVQVKFMDIHVRMTWLAGYCCSNSPIRTHWSLQIQMSGLERMEPFFFFFFAAYIQGHIHIIHSAYIQGPIHVIHSDNANQ